MALEPQPLWPVEPVPLKYTALEVSGLFVPIVGWGMTWMLRERRAKAVREHLQQQLLSRSDPAELWGDNPKRVAFARAVSGIIAKEIEWANDYFIPADPVKLLMWCPWCDIEGIEIARQIEKMGGRRLDWRTAASGVARQWVLGEMVDCYFPG